MKSSKAYEIICNSNNQILRGTKERQKPEHEHSIPLMMLKEVAKNTGDISEEIKLENYTCKQKKIQEKLSRKGHRMLLTYNNLMQQTLNLQ